MSCDYFSQTCNGPTKLPGSQKLSKNFDGMTFPALNADAENFSIEVGISKW